MSTGILPGYRLRAKRFSAAISFKPESTLCRYDLRLTKECDMPRYVRGFSLVWIGLTACCAIAQDSDFFRQMNQPIEPFRIIGNIYYVGASDVTSYLIVTDKGHILLDTGFKETAPMIERNVKTLGFSLSDVKILLSTHAHIDHAGGLARLKELTGARFMAMDDDVEQFKAGGKGDYAYGDTIPFPPISPDRILHDMDKVSLGGVELIAHKTPGHTKGCTTWTMKVEYNGRTLDVVFVGSPTVNPTILSNNPKYPNVIADYRKQFDILKSLKCDVFLGGHGFYFDMKAKIDHAKADPAVNPFIDPNGYTQFVRQAEQRFLDQLKKETGK
jgi:metallo-beta-lactamase class B